MSPAERPSANFDRKVVDDFGREWASFDQASVASDELEAIFEQYFAGFPWQQLPPAASGFDLGCGSGRWARFCAARVGELHCIDASAAALTVAQRNLAGSANCRFHRAAVDAMPLADASMDFGYALGVLHHVPDPGAGLVSCVAKLKRGAPFLLYLYYAFDNRPGWFRALWRVSDILRQVISRAPPALKYVASQVLAGALYLPLARFARLLERAGVDVRHLPLSGYRDKSFYTMRTDALDRFGTRLERRFTRAEMAQMMIAAGLERIVFNEGPPFWCAVGYKR